MVSRAINHPNKTPPNTTSVKFKSGGNSGAPAVE